MQQRPENTIAQEHGNVLEWILADGRDEAYARANDETLPIEQRHEAAIEAMMCHRFYKIARSPVRIP